MEGMPRLPMLAPDFKYSTSSLPAEFSAKIKEYILMHYQDDPSKYDAAINEMMSLRTQFGRLIPDVETVCQMKRYYAQLTMMKSRFPMEEGDPIKIPFSWLDKAMDMPSSTVYEDVNFELTCIMFNIGAVHAAIAANEARNDLDSIKNAFTHFQCAAFPFQHIRDKMSAGKYSSIDFEPSLLTWYLNVLLAQAQECILEKSLIDHRKNTVIAKIAIYLRDVYMNCNEHLESSGLSDVVSSSKYREWLRTCNVKAELYGAVAMVHLGEQADIDKKMGHRLAYYQIASEHVKGAAKFAEKDKRESLKQAIVFAMDVVIAKETNAKKENDFIYHDRIPRREELTIPEGVAMVKPIGFEPTDRSIAGDDLFAALLPMNVLKSVSIYSEEKAKFKRDVLERVAAKDKELEDYILSLQLDEINIDKSVDELKLPDMLLERSAAFNAQPDAFPDLLDKLQRVGHCAIEADHKLDDIHNRLAAIDSPDLTSDAGFKAIKKELERISDHHIKARTNNSQLQRAIAAHSENLRVLAMPLSELNRRISGPVVKPSQTAEGAQLKRMLDKTEEMKKQRSQLLETLSKDLENDDITTKCLAEKDLDNMDLYSRELKKHDEVVRLIDMNLAAQVKILAALTEANASFADCRRQVMELNRSRADQVLALTAAYDVYMDVLQKADEGLKFYSTLFSLVRTLDEAMEGIENAYEEERATKQKEKRQLEERARELRMAREAKDAMQQFHSQPIDSSELQSSIDFPSNTGGPTSIGGGRLKDYLAYYRTKIAGQIPLSSQQHPAGVIPPSSSALPLHTQGLNGLPGSLPQQCSPYVSASGFVPPTAVSSMSIPQGYQPNNAAALAISMQPLAGASLPGVMFPGAASTATDVMVPQSLQAASHQPFQMATSTQSPSIPRFAPSHPIPQSSAASFAAQSQPPPSLISTTGNVQPGQPPLSSGNFAQPIGRDVPQFQPVFNGPGSMQFTQCHAQTPGAPAEVTRNVVPPPQIPGQHAQDVAVSAYQSTTSAQQQHQAHDPRHAGQREMVPQPHAVTATQVMSGATCVLPSGQAVPPTTVPQQIQSRTAPATTHTATLLVNSMMSLQNQSHPQPHTVGPVNASSGTQFVGPPLTSLPQVTSSAVTFTTYNPSRLEHQSQMSNNAQLKPNVNSSVTAQTCGSGSAFISIPQQTANAAMASQIPTCNRLSGSSFAASSVPTSNLMSQPNVVPVSEQFQSPFAPSAQVTSDSAGILSPWHQSLLTNPESLIYGDGKLLNQSSSMQQSRHSNSQPSSNISSVPSSASDLITRPPTSVHQSASAHQNAVPHAPIAQDVDLMSSPLNANLPPPLMPSTQQMQQQVASSSSDTPALASNTHFEDCINSQSIAKSELSAQQVQQPIVTSESILSRAPNTESIQMPTAQCSIADTLPNGGGIVLAEQCWSSVVITAVQPSPRPAAAVAPIVQSNSSTSLASDVVLGMTSVTSLSYTSTTSAMHKPSQATAVNSSGQMSSLNQTNEASGSQLRDILNPETFTIGEADATRLEKRQLREQFKAQGTAAELPPLNPADPLNCLDAHYWINK